VMSEEAESAKLVELPGPIRIPALRWVYQTVATARLTLRNVVLRKRALLVVLVACVPILAAVALRYWMPIGAGRPPAQQFFTSLFIGLYIYFVILLTTIFFGTSLFADERGDRTITFLLIRPVPREVIVVGKFLTYAVSASVMLLASLAVTYTILSGMDGDSEAFRKAVPFMRHARVVVLGVLAYGALFTFFGTIFRRPVIAGFLYCFMWESILPYLPVFLKKGTVMYYVHSLTPHWKAKEVFLAFAAEPPPPEVAVWTLIGVCAAFLVLTAIALRVKEYKFEKEL
jgi:ABC-type transport system involved in multi-copper enzyme maturation permease subunit